MVELVVDLLFKDFKRLGEVEHFGDRWCFFQRVAAKRVREAGKLAM